MSANLHALLANIIDYAGMFPPANLTLDRAIRNYARQRKSGDQWMLGRFIIPAARLSELAAAEKLFPENPPFLFSVLGRGGATADEFLRGLTEDLNDVVDFCRRHAGLVEVDVLEVKMPDGLTGPQHNQAACYTLIRAADLIEAFGPSSLKPFYEIGLGSHWRTCVAAALAVLSHVATYAETRLYGPFQHYQPAGFKVRCGGLKAAAFPSPEQLAQIIVSCRDHGIALKATAGLHHPVRRYDEGVKTHMHGFLNVFGAAVLALVHNLDEERVLNIIKDEDPSHFTFDDTNFRWGNLSATAADIAQARKQFAIAFGSCSFDEPREDLRALKLM